MICKVVVFFLFLINTIALYFYIDGLYIHPYTKTISRHDLLYLIIINAAFILFYLIRKNILDRYEER